MFKIKAGVLGKLLNMVDEINNGIIINMSDSGLSIKTKDDQNVIIGAFDVDKSVFETYTPGESFEIYAFQVLNILKHIKDPETLCQISRIDDITSLEIENKWFNITVKDGVQPEPRIPSIELPVSFRIGPDVLFRDIMQCGEFSEDITLIYTENNVNILSFDKDYENCMFKATYPQDNWIEKTYSSNFTLYLLVDLLSSLRYNSEFICTEIKLSFGNDYPLIIEGQVNDEFSFMFMLAPRITLKRTEYENPSTPAEKIFRKDA